MNDIHTDHLYHAATAFLNGHPTLSLPDSTPPPAFQIALTTPESQVPRLLANAPMDEHPTSHGRNRIAYERPGPETIVRHPQSALASSQPLSCFHWILPVHLAPYLADPWLRRSSMNCQLRPLGNLNSPSTWDGTTPTDGWPVGSF